MRTALNDSLSKFNQKVDRHADISYGEITKSHKYTEAFIKFIKICHNKNIPLILETPNINSDYMKQINLVKNWIFNC
jgi:endonuclease IV